VSELTQGYERKYTDQGRRPRGKGWDLPISGRCHVRSRTVPPGLLTVGGDDEDISGDPDEHTNMIPSARMLAEKYCDHHIIENVPRAPLDEPTVLNGRMFGMPISTSVLSRLRLKSPQPLV